ncbi:TPA: hypothetical protein ACGO6Q_001868 [Streptococcus suis]
MTKFNNKSFEILAKDTLNSALYLEGQSYRLKISAIRQYTEIVVRRLLDYSEKQFVTLGDSKIRNALRTRTSKNSLFSSSIENIRKIGNNSSHTNNIKEFTKEEFDTVVESLLNVYAYLLIDYFERHPFGSNPSVMTSFSILPPIIRYITLEQLYEHNPNNINVIDKLSLAILKAFDQTKAIDWVESKKEKLLSMNSTTNDFKQELIKKYGEELANFILCNTTTNMYELCMSKIYLIGRTIEEKGLLYHDFESAINYYKENGILKGKNPEIQEFNSIMEFLYLGRKSSSPY